MRALNPTAMFGVAGGALSLGIAALFATPSFPGWSSWGPTAGIAIGAAAIGLASSWLFTREDVNVDDARLRGRVTVDDTAFSEAFSGTFSAEGLVQELTQLGEALDERIPAAQTLLAAARSKVLVERSNALYSAWRLLAEDYYDAHDYEQSAKRRTLPPRGGPSTDDLRNGVFKARERFQRAARL